MSDHNRPVCVIGAGSWGTALAMVLSRLGRKVYLVARSAEKAEAMQQQRQNDVYLPGVSFPESLEVTADLTAALKQSEAVVLALPCSAAESVLPQLAEESEGIVIIASKGLHPETLERADEMVARHLGRERVAVLSGPSFAYEVARAKPTAIVMAAYDVATAADAAAFFDDTSFRVYTSTDIVGVALGGALKNVIALAAGISDGLQLGHNAIAALITRGIAEMSRLAEACGGRHETLSGLAGLGDLVLTCTGELSRNRRMGIALAQGMNMQAAREYIGQVVEGVRTAKAAYRLAQDKQIEVPIISAVYSVIEENVRPMDAVKQLMARPAEKPEY